MVEKIDRPEPPGYRIQETARSNDDEDQRQQKGDQEDDGYSGLIKVPGWQKYHTDAKDRKVIKIRRKDIVAIFFNQVTSQKGLVILDADLKLVNGQIFGNAHLFSRHLDDYWRLKKFNVGDEVPVDQIVKEDYVEVSVLHTGNVIRSRHESEAREEMEVRERSFLINDNLKWAAIIAVATLLLVLIFFFVI